MIEMAPVAAGPEAAAGGAENSGDVEMDDAARDLFGNSDDDEEPESKRSRSSRPPNPRVRRDGTVHGPVESGQTAWCLTLGCDMMARRPAQ